MNIDAMTVGDLKQIRTILGNAADTGHPYEIGACYFVETVTKYYLGRLVGVTAGELVLDEASWIPDTGRFNEALANGTAAEVEPCPGKVIVGRGAIVAALPWGKALLRGVK
jgi:hypothetical protein